MDDSSIRGAIERAMVDGGWALDDAAGIAFHMTDWLDDLGGLNRFFEAPDSMSDRDIRDLLMSVLVHVPHHMNAASKLVTGEPVDDVFDIGAVRGEQRPPG